jgi:chemotaxis protein methyltransferase WspC
MTQVEALLARVLGLDPASLGTTAVRELVEARLRARGCADEPSYLRLLETDKEELERLLEAAVVHETWFFREPAAFECLRDFALQRAARGTRSLRVLSAPCSTGEEPYSIAMTLLDAGLSPSAFSIDGIDVSEPALASARRGVYGKNSFRGGLRAKETHFEVTGSTFSLRENVRRSVRFGIGNILDPLLFSGAEFDVVFCKNLLIYLDRNARKTALGTIQRLLAPDGLVFAGHSESLEYMSVGFERFGESGSFAFRRLTSGRTPAAARAASAARPPTERRRTSVRPKKLADPHERRTNAPARPAPQRGPNAARPNAVPSASDLSAARALADKGSITEATEACEAYLKRDAESAEAHCLLGLLQQSAGNLSAARASLERAVYLNPESHEALVHLALVHDKLGDRNQAAQLKRRAERRLGRKVQP